MPQYVWSQAAIAPNMNGLDGIATVSHNGKLFALGGWAANGARFNHVTYTEDGETYTPSLKTPTWAGRHVFPAVSHNGRIWVIGGDSNSGNYQPDIHSWNGEEAAGPENDWIVEDTNVPFLNRVGHYAFSYGGYIWVGGGQTITPQSPAPTTFFTDLWRSPTGAPGTWELYSDEMPIGFRGFLSNNPVELNGNIYFVGGGTYETTDFPGWQNRVYKNDILVMLPDFSIRLLSHGKGSILNGLMYHNVVAWDGKIWILGGFRGADQNTVFVFDPADKSVIQLPAPPWSARHAAVAYVINDILYFGTGAYDFDMWKLTKIPDPVEIPGVHYGAIADSTTGLSTVFTVIDKTITLTPGATVDKIGMSRTSSGNMTPKIVRQTAANTFDFVYSGASELHPGGGYHDFDIPDFVVPDDGYTYRLGFAFSYPYSDTYSFAGTGRWMYQGNLTGNAQGLPHYTDGSIAARWIEKLNP